MGIVHKIRIIVGNGACPRVAGNPVDRYAPARRQSEDTVFNQLISNKILPCLLCAFTLNLPSTVAQADGSSASPINGLVYLINSHADVEMDGLLRWEQELAERGLTAMIKASSEVLETNPAVFKRLAEEGHEIIGGYAGICWDKPYDEQYEAMKAVKSQMEDLTGRPMKVFACAYSSYDENTVRAAEALGVPSQCGCIEILRVFPHHLSERPGILGLQPGNTACNRRHDPALETSLMFSSAADKSPDLH